MAFYCRHIYRRQWPDEVKKIIEENNGKVVYVPNNMTHKFQSLDLTVNRCCKAFPRKNGQDWYSNDIRREMEKGMQAHEIRISVLKPLHASWVTKFYGKM